MINLKIIWIITSSFVCCQNKMLQLVTSVVTHNGQLPGILADSPMQEPSQDQLFVG